MNDLDLTPFGFTPTENLAYGALLNLGPSSGYAVAKALSIARANAYQALNGLVAKGAAVRTEDQPRRYRGERPDAILARVINAESEKLDALEAQVEAQGRQPGAPIVEITGRRGLINTALRTLAREPEAVTCIGPAEMLVALSAAWRRRVADDREQTVWAIGESPADLPFTPAGDVDGDLVRQWFGGPVFLLVAADVGVAAQMDREQVRGYWTSDDTIVGVIRAALSALSSSGG